jgi:hypothetical protein
VVVPALAVDGVGATALPPVRPALLYHVKVLVPVAVAVSGTAALFRQYGTGEDTIGAEGFGFTVMVKETGVPEQPLTLGVTVIVAVTAEALELLSVKEEILPVPDEGRPMEVVLLVQLNTVPLILPEKVSAPEAAPAHFISLAGVVTSGGVFTVIG